MHFAGEAGTRLYRTGCQYYAGFQLDFELTSSRSGVESAEPPLPVADGALIRIRYANPQTRAWSAVMPLHQSANRRCADRVLTGGDFSGDRRKQCRKGT